MFRFALFSRTVNSCGGGVGDKPLFYKKGKKNIPGNQFSGAGGAGVAFRIKKLEKFRYVGSMHLGGCCCRAIIFREPGEKLPNIYAVCLDRQRAFVQFPDKSPLTIQAYRVDIRQFLTWIVNGLLSSSRTKAR